MTQQKVLFWNEQPLEMSVLGEKPHKLMQLKQAGFSVPDFCTIVTDGSGSLTIDDTVRSAFDKLKKPLIARSAHPMEGGGFSFSGVFQSVERVVRLEDSPEDLVNYKDPLDNDEELPEGQEVYDLYYKWINTRTLSLLRAYSEILELAKPTGESVASNDVKSYLSSNGITGFNPNDMNVLLMEQRDVQVFGMFMTSDQTRPDEIVIHYQDIRTGKGNWVVYDKKTEMLKAKLEDDLESILTEFGRTAAKVEQKFGKVQQVEIGYSDHGVEVYQSRDLNLGNAAAVPRFAHYKTFSKDLRTNGFGYFHLPVLVIDSLSNFSEECGLSGAEKIERVVKPYKAELQRFMEQHPEYIVIVKDGELFEPWYSGKTERELGFVSKEEKYAELNAVTRRAKVMFAGRNQNAIRHEDWDNVESGGINIWMGEQEKLNNLFAHKSRYDKYRFPDREESVSQNLTLLRGITPIKTGDYLHVLSNLDGVFVWRD